ncbi:MAG: dienelactone hydrolase [Spirochaeta sp. LUC14_002_19_P3]|nr:MAG: dienelactone hydrolase [Spirochaeta sp. LUC14_002_19_P3]
MLFLLILIPALHLAAIPQEKRISYKYQGTEYEGYFIRVGNNNPLVYLVHDWDGLNDYEIRRAKMLSQEGYNVFAIDLFGKGVKADSMDDRRRLTGELYQNRDKMRGIMLASMKAMKDAGLKETNAVAAGYCFGGSAVLELARSGTALKGFVPFHGGLATPDGQDFTRTKGKIVVFHGTADASVSMEEFANLASELEKSGISHEMITYSGAPHAFTVFDSPRYQKTADEQSWARFLRFLKEEL